MVGAVKSTDIGERMETNESFEPKAVETLKETVIVAQHNWQEVYKLNNNETFFVGYRLPEWQKSVFFDVSTKNKQFQSSLVDCEKLPGRALKVKFPQLNGISKCFVHALAEYDAIHKGQINAIDSNKSGNLIVSTDPNSGMIIWNSSSGEILRQLEGHVLDVNCCRFFPSGMIVLSGGIDMSVRIWSVETGNCPRVLTGHTAPILDLEFVGVGEEVLSSARDKTIKQWNCGSGQCVATLSVPRGSVNSFKLKSDKSFLLGASNQGSLYLWDTKSKQLIADVNVHDSCTSLSFNEDYAFVGTNNGNINVVDLRQKKLISSLKVNRGCVQKVRAINTGVLASFADGGVCFYPEPIRSAQSSIEFTGSDIDPCYDFTISKYLFTACRDKIIRKYAIDSYLTI